MDDELEAIRRKKMEELKSGASADAPKPAAPIVIKDADFNAFVAKYPVVVVDCWAPWCGPCRMVAPVVDALAKEMSGQVVFAKLNTDENPAVPNKYSISAIPTMLVFREGKMVDRIVGAMPKEQLAAKIRKYL
jgi:thioredoxin 1